MRKFQAGKEREAYHNRLQRKRARLIRTAKTGLLPPGRRGKKRRSVREEKLGASAVRNPNERDDFCLSAKGKE